MFGGRERMLWLTARAAAQWQFTCSHIHSLHQPFIHTRSLFQDERNHIYASKRRSVEHKTPNDPINSIPALSTTINLLGPARRTRPKEHWPCRWYYQLPLFPLQPVEIHYVEAAIGEVPGFGRWRRGVRLGPTGIATSPGSMRSILIWCRHTICHWTLLAFSLRHLYNRLTLSLASR